MKKANRLVLNQLYNSLDHYRRVYNDKTAQLFDAHGKIKILESNAAELSDRCQTYFEELKHRATKDETNRLCAKADALQVDNELLNERLKGMADRRDDFMVEYRALDVKLDEANQLNVDATKQRDRLSRQVDSVCERNRWYSDLIFAMTGNRDHETMQLTDLVVEAKVDKTGNVTEQGVSVTHETPGKDCRRAFCKSQLSARCLRTDGQQCPDGICEREEQATCMHCRCPLDCYGNCTGTCPAEYLPF